MSQESLTMGTTAWDDFKDKITEAFQLLEQMSLGLQVLAIQHTDSYVRQWKEANIVSTTSGLNSSVINTVSGQVITVLTDTDGSAAVDPTFADQLIKEEVTDLQGLVQDGAAVTESIEISEQFDPGIGNDDDDGDGQAVTVVTVEQHQQDFLGDETGEGTQVQVTEEECMYVVQGHEDAETQGDSSEQVTAYLEDHTMQQEPQLAGHQSQDTESHTQTSERFVAEQPNIVRIMPVSTKPSSSSAAVGINTARFEMSTEPQQLLTEIKQEATEIHAVERQAFSESAGVSLLPQRRSDCVQRQVTQPPIVLEGLNLSASDLVRQLPSVPVMPGRKRGRPRKKRASDEDKDKEENEDADSFEKKDLDAEKLDPFTPRRSGRQSKASVKLKESGESARTKKTAEKTDSPQKNIGEALLSEPDVKTNSTRKSKADTSSKVGLEKKKNADYAAKDSVDNTPRQSPRKSRTKEQISKGSSPISQAKRGKVTDTGSVSSPSSKSGLQTRKSKRTAASEDEIKQEQAPQSKKLRIEEPLEGAESPSRNLKVKSKRKSGAEQLAESDLSKKAITPGPAPASQQKDTSSRRSGRSIKRPKKFENYLDSADNKKDLRESSEDAKKPTAGFEKEAEIAASSKELSTTLQSEKEAAISKLDEVKDAQTSASGTVDDTIECEAEHTFDSETNLFDSSAAEDDRDNDYTPSPSELKESSGDNDAKPENMSWSSEIESNDFVNEGVIKIKEEKTDEERAATEEAALALLQSVCLKRGRGRPKGRKNSRTRWKPTVCDICGMNFPTPSRLKSHLLVHSDEKPLMCEICGKPFKYVAALKHHLKVHLGVRDFACTLCDYKASSRSQALNHVRKVHTQERPYQCQICGQGFHSTKGLWGHRAVHQDQNYKCDQCDFSTARRNTLVLHKRNKHEEAVHAFQCHLCERKFKHKESYTVHQRSHTGERPYSCRHCGAIFPSTSQRAQHERTHQEPRFQCLTCSKKFITKHQLNRHSAIHTGAKNYPCPFCNYKCSMDTNLRKHCRNVHKVVYPPLVKPIKRRANIKDPHLQEETENRQTKPKVSRKIVQSAAKQQPAALVEHQPQVTFQRHTSSEKSNTLHAVEISELKNGNEVAYVNQEGVDYPWVVKEQDEIVETVVPESAVTTVVGKDAEALLEQLQAGHMEVVSMPPPDSEEQVQKIVITKNLNDIGEVVLSPEEYDAWDSGTGVIQLIQVEDGDEVTVTQ